MPTQESDGFLEDVNLDGEDNSDDGFLEDFDLSDDEGSERTTVSYRPTVHFQSSEDMGQVDDESVHLVVTSPPYNAGWEYGSHDDDNDYYDEYLPMLGRVFRECWRVLVPGGRLCVNVPSLLRDGSSGGYPIAADITRMLVNPGVAVVTLGEGNQGDSFMMELGKLRDETNFIIREQIAWFKKFNADGLAPNGSFPRPWGVLLNNMHEVVLVFQKPGQRDYDDMSDERIEESKINKKNDDLCDDVWTISPESFSFSYVEGEDVPVFPEELVRRCIKIWSYKDDTVLDPFAGRFTVGKVAKDMKRESVGFEVREGLEKDIKEYTGMDQQGLGAW